MFEPSTVNELLLMYNQWPSVGITKQLGTIGEHIIISLVRSSIIFLGKSLATY